MTDILITHSYHLPYDRKQVRKMQPYPPLATLYAAALLRQMGFSVAVFDTMLEDPVSDFPRALVMHQPKIVVIYEDDFNFLTKMCLTRMREVAWQMAAQASAAGAVTIAHGSDATDHTREFLLAGFDFVLLGDSELTLAETCDMLLHGNDANSLPGIATLDATSGKVMRTAPRRPSFPHIASSRPARDAIDLSRYRTVWRRAHGKFSLNLISSRGCPFRCNWCAKPIFGDTFAIRSADDVADEVAELKVDFGAEHLWFADDVFALNRHWVNDFADAIVERDCAVPFKIQSRADLMTGSTVGALQRAGCAEVWMGVESGSQKVLDAMQKGLRVKEVFSAREYLRVHSIQACFFLQFGYPGESWEDILTTVELVRSTRPDDVGISFSYPLPGTRFHERVREQMGVKHNWRDSDDLCVMFHGAYTNKFYRAIRDAIHAEVNSWNGQGQYLSDVEIRAIWQEIERNEPSSRNPDVTILRPEEQEAQFQPDNFVALADFNRTGANCG
jgi:anaerobic magnesium-protoporphyrin IX monomethyl ester cyclase